MDVGLLVFIVFCVALILRIICYYWCRIPGEESENQWGRYLFHNDRRVPFHRRRRTFIRRNTEELFQDQNESTGTTSEGPAASPMVVPPYPVEPLHPIPQSGQVPQVPGFAVSNPPYPTHTPHPVAAPFAYPPPVGVPPTAPFTAVPTPYPPTIPPGVSSAPYPDYSAQPPSYSEAVGQPPVPTPIPPKDGYTKQSPYNPNY